MRTITHEDTEKELCSKISSFLSPFKITRNREICTSCTKCSRACPSNITVHTKDRIHSDECMACMACVEACPVDSALEFKLTRGKMALSGYHLAVMVIITYFAFVAAGVATGNWRNSISIHEYIVRKLDITNPVYNHNRGKRLY